MYTYNGSVLSLRTYRRHLRHSSDINCASFTNLESPIATIQIILVEDVSLS